MTFRSIHAVSRLTGLTLLCSLGALFLVTSASPSCAQEAAPASTPKTASTSPTMRYENTRLTLASLQNRRLTASTLAASTVSQVPPIGAFSPFPVALRLGAMLSPRTKADVGIDVTLPHLGIGPGWDARLDADVIISANFGGISTLVPITFDEIYTHTLPGGAPIYIGGGIGAYIGNTTRFGGKVLVGAGLSKQLAAELAVHWPGFSDTLVTLQLRIGLR
ncbi:MAG TPA: hypothetical protein VFA07_05805 [Chthonomonadaceae bacterium]|nr:hypothetical protein [Chthonomonadaceae bacterium]